jgi:hypothetical protein
VPEKSPSDLGGVLDEIVLLALEVVVEELHELLVGLWNRVQVVPFLRGEAHSEQM